VTNMSSMFYNCQNLTELDLSNWDVSKMTDMDHMFYNCPIQYVKKGNKLIKR